LIYNLWLSGIGLLLMLGSMFGWSLEPATDPDAGHDGHGDHQDPDITDSDGGDNNTAEEAPVG
jgi:hypothetical protein